MACHAPAVGAPVPARSPSCAGCSHLRGLLAEQRGVLRGLLDGLGLILAAQRISRSNAELAARPPCDLDMERLVLGAALRQRIGPPPDLFGDLLHREIATTIHARALHSLDPAMRAYARSLMRIACSTAELRLAFEILLDVAQERAALQAAERAVAALRGSGGPKVARAEMQRAIDALEGTRSADPRGDIV